MDLGGRPKCTMLFANHLPSSFLNTPRTTCFSNFPESSSPTISSTPPPSKQFTTTTIKLSIITNVAESLRTNGFNIIATLLNISPQLFLSTPQSTIFVIHEHTFSNLFLLPPFLKQFLLYEYSIKNEIGDVVQSLHSLAKP